MDCDKANPQLSALASGSLATEDEAELRSHLDSCEECSFEFEKLRGGESSPAGAPNPEPESVLDVAPLAPPVDVAPLAPPASDWTVEKIFGDGPGPSAAPAPPANSRPHAILTPPPIAAPQPAALAPAASVPPATDSIFPSSGASFHDVALPMTTPTPTPAPSAPSPGPTSMIPPLPPPAAGSPPGKKPGGGEWDFEPADAAKEATPPEESLLFAEQALHRRLGDTNRKNAALRMLLWGGGAVVGVGLLGVSLWMAMQDRGPASREIAARVKPTAGASTTVTRSVPGGEAAPIDSASSAAGTDGPGSSGPNPATATTPDPAAAVSTPPPPAPIKSGLAPRVGTPAGSAPNASKTATASGAKGATAPKPKAPVVTEKTVAATPPPDISKLVLDDDEMWPVDDPVSPAPATRKGTASTKPDVTSPAEKPSTGSTSDGGRTAGDEPAAPAAPNADMNPFDRIHAATEQAAKDEDLEALRRLKVTWRNLTRTVVGPNRSRAKREFADCLWHIQALTGRDSDQREALLAYRDFLISAPAGGADARSAARLRELEDAFAERR